VRCDKLAARLTMIMGGVFELPLIRLLLSGEECGVSLSFASGEDVRERIDRELEAGPRAL
jgi:hypothetical protein